MSEGGSPPCPINAPVRGHHKIINYIKNFMGGHRDGGPHTLIPQRDATWGVGEAYALPTSLCPTATLRSAGVREG